MPVKSADELNQLTRKILVGVGASERQCRPEWPKR